MSPETTTMTLQIQCPVDVYRVLESHGLLGDLLAIKTQRQLATSLYQEHVLSVGQAAQLAGMPLAAFMALLEERQIPVIEYTQADWEHDRAVVRELAMNE